MSLRIDEIRNIGQKLRKEILNSLNELRDTRSLGRGASGDITHPIDRRAEEMIFQEIMEIKRPITVVSEESGFTDFFGGGPRLLIDPIDGSKNAVSGITTFSTSIALVNGDTIGDIIIGYVINIISGDEYWSVKGEGSFLNGRRIQTQEDSKLKVIAYETQVPGRDIARILSLLSHFNRTRCFGSTALDMSFLAQGAISVFITPAPSRSFDFAAGYLIVKEAGGIITDTEGNDIEGVQIGVKRTIPLLASANQSIHKRVIDILRQNTDLQK